MSQCSSCGLDKLVIQSFHLECQGSTERSLAPNFLPVSLIELLAEVLDAEQSLFGKKVRPVDDWLRRYLKVSEIVCVKEQEHMTVM